VDADGLNMARFHQLMSNRPVLVFDAIKPGEPLPRQQVEATAEFLRRRLVAPAGVTALAD
jgi:hypothetical protein